MTGRHVLLVLGSAGVHALAFPPWDLSPVAFVALVPLLLCVRELSPGRAAAAGCLWGSAAIWAVGGWVAPAIAFYYQQPWWFGVLFCAVGCVLLWGAYYAAFAAAGSWLWRRTRAPLRPILLAALWVSCELARARVVAAQPWMLLGYSLSPVPLLVQGADVGGVYLLSFVVALTNATLVEAMTAPFAAARRLVPAVSALALLIAYGGWRLVRPLDGGPPVRVAVVQGNNEIRTQWRSEFYGQGLDRYLRLSRDVAASRPRLLVWPESAVTFFLEEEPAYRSHVARVLSALDAELLVGGPSRRTAGDGGVVNYNSAFLMDGAGDIQARYDKVRLLPFAEYFPLQFIGFLRRHFDAVRDFGAGNDVVLLPTVAGRAAVVICFEAIFPELLRDHVTRGAELIVNLSNDVWLAGPGAVQHLRMVQLRAVETRRWVIRATTTGVSAVIDPLGRERTRAPADTEAVLTALVQPLSVTTPYQRFGDAFAVGCVLVTLVAATVLSRRRAVG